MGIVRLSDLRDSVSLAAEWACSQQARDEDQDVARRRRSQGPSLAAHGRRDSLASACSSVSGIQPRETGEIDTYYQGRFGFGQYPIIFNPVVLGCVQRENPVRKVCIAIVRHIAFESIILSLILANTVTMALWDPVDDVLGIHSQVNSVIQALEWVFLPAFTLEAIIKLIAQGAFVRPSGYFLELWNWLDFSIVLLGWIPIIIAAASRDADAGATSSLTVFRMIRVLRPLRALQFFPNLKSLVKAILGAAMSIGAVLVLCLSILLVFSIVGITLFKGKLRQHCGVAEDPRTGTWAIPADEAEAFCSMSPEYHGRACPANLTCIATDFNPNAGLQSFDNLGLALLTVLQVITEEGWSGIMFSLFDTTYHVVGVYFVLLILFGSYIMVNLLVSALSVNYMLVRKEDKLKSGLERERNNFMGKVIADAEARSRSLDRFLSRTCAQQKQQMEMRLMYSYDQHRDDAGYNVVTDDMYNEYYRRNIAHYPHFRRKLERNLKRQSFVRKSSTAQHRISTLLPASLASDIRNGRVSIDTINLRTQADRGVGTKTRMRSRDDGFADSFPTLHDIYQAYPPFGKDNEVTDVQMLQDIEMGSLSSRVSAASSSSPDRVDPASDQVADVEDNSSDEFHDVDLNDQHADSRRRHGLSVSSEISDLSGYHDAVEYRRNSLRADADLAAQEGARDEPPRPPERADLYVNTTSFAHLPHAEQTGHSRDGDPKSSAHAQMSRAPSMPASEADTERSRLALDVDLGSQLSGEPPEPLGLSPNAPKWRAALYHYIVRKFWFKLFALGLIVLNTVVLASEYFGQPAWLTSLQTISNLVFLVLFTLETVLRIAAEGGAFYFHFWFNRFDFFIIVMGYVELALDGNVASVFRLLRILRFLKLAHYWPTFHDLIVAVDATVKQLCPFLVFFGIFLYIFTVSGLQLLGGRLALELEIEEAAFVYPEGVDPPPETLSAAQRNPDFDCTTEAGDFWRELDNGTFIWHCPVRANYDTFLWSLVTSFQVISGEDWNSVMATAVELTGQGAFVLYYVFLVLFGTYIVLNFFLAILVDTFVELHMERKEAKKKKRLLKALRSASRLETSEASESATPSMSLVSIRENEVIPVSTTDDSPPASGPVPRGAVASNLLSPLRDVSSPSPATPPVDPLPPAAAHGLGPASPTTAASRDPGKPTDELARSIRDSLRLGDAALNPPASVAQPASAKSVKQVERLGSQVSGNGEPAKKRRPRASKTGSLQDVLAKESLRVYDLSESEILELEAFQHNSLLVIPPQNRLRIRVAVLVHKAWFDIFILVIIFASCVLLALDSPASSLDRSVLDGFNIFVTTIFTLEACLKIFAFGLWRGHGAYLRDPWNVLDFSIVIVSLVDLSLPSADTSLLQVFRALRALRPLRTVRKFEGLRIVFSSLTRAFVPCAQVLALCLLFYVVFSICSTTFFLGKLHACYSCTPSDDGQGLETCLRNYTVGSPDCYLYPDYDINAEKCPLARRCVGSVTLEDGTNATLRWLNPTYGSLSEYEPTASSYTFDSFYESLLLLFEVSSMEIWMEPMYMVTDATSIGFGPVRGSNDVASLFFIVFLFTLQFFMLQVFVAVLIDTYFDSADTERGDAFMTPEQRVWVDYNRRAVARPFKPHARLNMPKNKARARCYRIVTSERFDIFITVIILLNTVLLMSDHYPSSAAYDLTATVLDSIFGSIYVCEAVLKIVGLGPRVYFKLGSNIFDFVIVLAVIVNWVVTAVPSTANEAGHLLQAIEAVRVLRVMRLLQRLPPVKPLLSTLIYTMYPLLNTLGIILLCNFIYAILGMQLFGGIDVNQFPANEMQYLSPYINFESFLTAFMTLFVMTTGESWNGIMHDLSFVSPHAVWFCVSFVVIMQLLLINLFVAVVLASFASQFERSKKGGAKEHIDENALKDYNVQWNHVHMSYIRDLEALYRLEEKRVGPDHPPVAFERAARLLEQARANPLFLPATKFPDLMLCLKAPLGFRKRSKKARFSTGDVMRYVSDRHIPVTRDGMIHFHATLRALIDINVLQGQVPEEVEKFLQIKLNAYTRNVEFASASPLSAGAGNQHRHRRAALAQIKRLGGLSPALRGRSGQPSADDATSASTRVDMYEREEGLDGRPGGAASGQNDDAERENNVADNEEDDLDVRSSDSTPSLSRILAREQIKKLIHNYATVWRIRQMRKHGVSEPKIRDFILQNDRDYLEANPPQVPGVTYPSIL